MTVAAYDVLGREVARLFAGVATGTHALTLDGARLAPGRYTVRALGDGVAAARVLIRGR